MEISFENKKVSAYCEVFHQTKRIQESADSVVPDINEDIGRIVSVRTEVFLKSKDVTSRGVSVGGEAEAVLLYITEGEDRVSFVRIVRPFSMEYEIADTDADLLPQVSLSILNSEARILNPRKVSVVFEICGELSCYREENVCIENGLPADCGIRLHTKYEESRIMLNNSVCEKTFAVNEQFPFPADKPAPENLVSCRADFCLSDTQMIGSKLIVKGNAHLEAVYLPAEECYPITAEFNTPFSQIIDTGRENVESCTAFITQTSCYFDLIDSINGEKTLDAEIHAVTQAVSRCHVSVNYITDAYSNEMPVVCTFSSHAYHTEAETQLVKLGKNERINISEDCEDVLCVLTSISQTTQQQNKLGCTLAADILYKNTNGSLSSVRRIMELEGDSIGAGKIVSTRLCDVMIRPDGEAVDAHISAEVCVLNCSSAEFTAVSSVFADEDDRYDFESFPALTLVRAENESLWELAKKYHSCMDCISEVNDGKEISRLMMIPKSV